MLSQLRWIMGVAIGVAIIVAVWLEPDVRDPSGEPAEPRARMQRVSPAVPPPSSTGAEAADSASPSVRWQRRLAAYWADLDGLRDAPGAVPEDTQKQREALLAEHFSVEERPLVRALDASRPR